MDNVFDSSSPPLAWGIDLPSDLRERIDHLSAPLPPDGVLDGTAGGREVLRVWRATARHKKIADQLAWAVLLDAIRRIFESRPPNLREALAAERMSLGRTVAEVNLQLGSRLYHLAWKLVSEAPDGSAARTLFQRCIEAFDRAQAQGVRLPPAALRGITGMRGVARVVLSREEADSVERLEAAISDLEAAEVHGDTSPPHFAFLAEAHLGLFQLIGGDYLERAEKSLAKADAVGYRTRTLELSRAEAVARRAFAALEDERKEAAVELFGRASEICTKALTVRADAARTSDDVVRGKRGQWRFQRARFEPDASERVALLDAAIEDLRQSPMRGTSLPWALVSRAESLRRAAEWDAVLADGEEALAYVDGQGVDEGRLRERIEGLISEARTWSGVDDGSTRLALAGVRRLLDLAEKEEVSLAAISHGLRAAEPLLGPMELEELCERAAQVARRQLEDTSLSREARVFAASHGGSLLWSVARVRDDIAILRFTHGLYREGIDLGEEDVALEMLSSAGACALRLAKLLAARSQRDREEAVDLLQDACRYLAIALEMWQEEGRPARPNGATMWSTLGDAFVRRYGLTHDSEHADAALEALNEARALGGNAARVEDLLGQLHYRRGRITRSQSDLRAALQHKQAAAEAAVASRENLSVRAAAELTLYDIDGGPEHLVAAAEYAASALEVDPTWPWPLLQLATVAKQVDEAEVDEVETTPLELALAGKEKALLRLAAERAVSAAEELPEHILGGRQKAFVLSDPHNLLAQTLVLKPTPRKNAEREWREADALRDFIASREAPLLRVPEPLAIVEQPHGPPVYVMRRANGRELGRLILSTDDADRPQLLETVERTLCFLALFHAKAAEGERLRSWTPKSRRQAARDHGRSLLMLGISSDQVAPAREAFRAAADQFSVPLLAKKDAHPENWLVGSDRAIVMLDLEASAKRPALAEVVQLLEDYPLCEVSEAGFSQRIQLVDRYLEALAAHGVELDLPVRGLYELFALQRAVFGLALLSAVRERASSSAAIDSASARQAHLCQLCRWLASHAREPCVRKAADAVAETLGQRRL